MARNRKFVLLRTRSAGLPVMAYVGTETKLGNSHSEIRLRLAGFSCTYATRSPRSSTRSPSALPCVSGSTTQPWAELCVHA